MKIEAFIWLFLIFLVTSCSPLIKDISSPQSIITMSATPIPVSTSTELATFTSLPTAKVESVQTRLPTLNSQNPSLTVKELLENNRGCHLPCWWGIIPGQTSWRDVEESLAPITTSIYETTSENSNPRYFEVFFPAPYPSTGEFRQEYLIESSIVKRMEILPQHFSKYSVPNGLLQEFGDPETIFLGGSVEQPQSFQLILYYPSRGIFVLYSNELRPFQQQEVLDVCFTEAEIEYVDMFLWDPVDSFSKTLDYVFRQYSRPFYEIELVTNLTISEFSDLFESSDQIGCFQTPSSLWRN